MLFSRRTIQLLTKRVGQRHASHGNEHAGKSTLDDLPLAQGNYATNFAYRQRVYNLQLIGSIVTLLGSIFLGIATGLLEGHGKFPARPVDVNIYKE